MKKITLTALMLAALTATGASAQPLATKQKKQAAARAAVKPAPAPAVPLSDVTKKDTLLCVKSESFGVSGEVENRRVVGYNDYGVAVSLQEYSNGETADYAFRYTIDPANDCWTVRSVGRMEGGNFVETEREERELDAARRVVHRTLYGPTYDYATGTEIAFTKLEEYRYDYAHVYLGSDGRETCGALVESWRHENLDYSGHEKFAWFAPARKYVQVFHADGQGVTQSESVLDEAAGTVTCSDYTVGDNGVPYLSSKSVDYYGNGVNWGGMYESYASDGTLYGRFGSKYEFEENTPAGFMQVTEYKYNKSDQSFTPSVRMQIKGRQYVTDWEFRYFNYDESAGDWKLNYTDLTTAEANHLFRTETVRADGSYGGRIEYRYIFDDGQTQIDEPAYRHPDGSFVVEKGQYAAYNNRMQYVEYHLYDAQGRKTNELRYYTAQKVGWSILEDTPRCMEMKDGALVPFAGSFKICDEAQKPYLSSFDVYTFDANGYETAFETYAIGTDGVEHLNVERTTKRTAEALDIVTRQRTGTFADPKWHTAKTVEGRMLDGGVYQYTRNEYTQAEQEKPNKSVRFTYKEGLKTSYTWNAETGEYAANRTFADDGGYYALSEDGLTETIIRYGYGTPPVPEEKIVKRTVKGDHVLTVHTTAFAYDAEHQSWTPKDSTVSMMPDAEFYIRPGKTPWRLGDTSIPGYEYVTEYADLLEITPEIEPNLDIIGYWIRNANTYYVYEDGRWVNASDTGSEQSLECVSLTPGEVVYKLHGDQKISGVKSTVTYTVRKDDAGYLTYHGAEEVTTPGDGSPSSTQQEVNIYEMNDLHYVTVQTGVSDYGESRTVYTYEPAKVICLGIEDAVAQPAGAFNPALPVYDLSGRRVSTPLRPGIYVQQGHKVIVK